MRRRVKGNVAGSREQDFGSPESPESPASPVAKLNRSVSFFDDELPPSILPPSGKRSPPVHRPHHRPVQAAHDPDEHFAVAKRQRPPNIQTDFRSPLPIGVNFCHYFALVPACVHVFMQRRQEPRGAFCPIWRILYYHPNLNPMVLTWHHVFLPVRV
jgi:hypothetical protein